MKRRDFLKAAATTPVLGAFGVALYSKESYDKAAHAYAWSFRRGTLFERISR